jgi:hypothetical protein
MGCERFHRKTRSETEVKFQSLSKGGMGPATKRNKYRLRVRLGLEFINTNLTT